MTSAAFAAATGPLFRCRRGLLCRRDLFYGDDFLHGRSFCRLLGGWLLRGWLCRLLRGRFCRMLRGWLCRLLRGRFCRGLDGWFCRVLDGRFGWCRVLRGWLLGGRLDGFFLDRHFFPPLGLTMYVLLTKRFARRSANKNFILQTKTFAAVFRSQQRRFSGGRQRRSRGKGCPRRPAPAGLASPTSRDSMTSLVTAVATRRARASPDVRFGSKA